MTNSAVSGAAPLFLAGDLTTDTPCRKCGYNLRGLSVSGLCPECGTPIGVSINGELLRYSDPDYLETLRLGVNLILWGILAIIVMGILAGVGGAMRLSPIIVQLLILAASVPSIIGGWFLTSPDPAGIGEAQYGTARKIIRISLIVGATNSLLNLPLGVGGLPAAAMLALQTLQFLVAIVGLIGQFAQLAYLRKLAMRIPDDSLSERAKILMWGIGGSYGALLVFGFLAVLLGSSLGPGLVLFGCAASLIAVCVLVFGVMYLFMLGRFAGRFREQAALARLIWAGGGQPRAPGIGGPAQA